MMIRRGWRTGALVLATVWLTGCAGTGAPLTQSGFLQDYARLQPRDDATVAWLNPSTRPFGERPLVVEPVVIREQQVEGEVISLADNRYSNLRVWLRDAVEARLKAAGYTVADDGLVVPLSNAEFRLLWVFLERPRRVLNRELLLDAARGRAIEAFDRSIDLLVSRLRHKLSDDPRDPSIIKTIRGAGYVFNAQDVQGYAGGPA